jgi:aspartate aminotransferase
MAIAKGIKEAISGSSMIRKMFEEGMRLKAQYGADKVFDFSIGNPDLEPPPEFHAAFLAMAQADAPGSHAYMPNAGYPETRAAMAAKASREHGLAFPSDNVVMVVGAASGLNVVFKTLLNPGDEILVQRPYFMEYRAYAANHGGVLKTVDPAEGFNLNVEGFAAALGPRTAAVLVNSPNNPTGRMYPEQDIRRLAEVLEAYGRKSGRRIYLVVDEPYRDIAYGGKVTPPIAKHYKDSIIVNSFSKSLSLPGERIGYIAVAPDCEDAKDMMAGLIMCNRVLGSVNAPALMQRLVEKLADVKMDMGRYERRRDAISAGMRASGYEFAQPDGAFYLFCKSPVADDRSFCDFLKQYNILTVPGSAFDCPGWFRMSYAVPEKTIENAIPVFKRALEEFKARA